MNRSRQRVLSLVLTATGSTIAAVAPQALAQSTAFTYQGELKQAGALASGSYDIRFKLFSTASGGAQVGSTLCIDNVQVTSGKFTSTLDFGQQFISVSDRFIEIEVRPDTGLNCTNTSGYTTLSPRQPLTPAPRAAAATTANSLAIPNGSSVLVNLTNNGNVGIGTNAPTSQLHLSGVQDAFKISGTQPFMTLVDTNASGARVLLQNEGGRYFTVSESFLNGTNTGGFTMLDQQGHLGLGVFDPGAVLDVGGRVQLRGAAGANSNSAGFYLASPMSSPTVRAFVGLRDDTHVGFFGSASGWSLTMDTVSGAVNLGSAGQYFVPAGEENLRIVRGTINGNGNVLAGSGFSSVLTSQGHYTVTFTTPFAALPTITLTPISPSLTNDYSTWAQIITISSSSFTMEVSNNSPAWVNRTVNMIAMGPR